MQFPKTTRIIAGGKGLLFSGAWPVIVRRREEALNPDRDHTPENRKWQGRGAIGLACLLLSSAALLGVLMTRSTLPTPPTERATPPPDKVKDVHQRLATMQIPFVANQGQTDARVKFYAQTFGGTVFVTTEGELVYALVQRDGKEPAKSVVLTEELNRTTEHSYTLQ